MSASSQHASTSVPRCDYCALPVPGARVEPVFCCSGCRLARAITSERGEAGEARWMQTGLGISLFFTINVVMLTMALWAWEDEPTSQFAIALGGLIRWIALVCTIPVIVWLGVPLGSQAIDQLRRGALSTDLLLLTGVVAAFAYSVVSTIRDTGHVYFEVSCVILVLVTLGRWLEATGRRRASQALEDLERLLPDTVTRITTRSEGTRCEETVRRCDITIGDQLCIRPGERIPADGMLVSGSAALDEQFLTGESQPVTRSAGHRVFGGALNLDGDLELQVEQPSESGVLGRLIRAVRDAQAQRGHYERVADSVSRVFFAVITIVALLTAVWHAHHSGIEAAILNSLAVVLIACPCGLALATPLAVWTTIAAAARRGVVIGGGDAIERVAAITAIRFDKTGTLTTGSPTVRLVQCETPSARDSVLRRAAALAAASNHVYSRAICEFVEHTAAFPMRSDATLFPGRGVAARLDGEPGLTIMGSPRLMQESGLLPGPRLAQILARDDIQSDGLTCIGWNGRLQGVFVFRELIRDEAAEVIQSCRQLGLDQAVLTGDRPERGIAISDALEITVTAGLLPDDKLSLIRSLQQRGERVAMIGDGLNDAPALALADVGIAMGCGTDVTRDTADICLVGNDLRTLPWLIRQSRDTVRVIRMNLLWSFAYNAGGVVLAACGWLHPAIASVLMVVSSLFVLGNSLRLMPESSSRTPPDSDVPVFDDAHLRSGAAALIDPGDDSASNLSPVKSERSVAQLAEQPA